MKLFGIELKFNGFDIFHKGNFNPDAKADKTEIPTKISDLANDIGLGGGGSIVFRNNTINITEPTNTVGIIGGTLLSFSANVDSILVFQNSTYIELNQDYTVSLDGKTIQKTSGVWEAGTILNVKVIQTTEASFIRRQERFTVAEGQILFNLTKGFYTINTGAIIWYLNGIRQDDNAIVEISSTSFGLPSGLLVGNEVMVEYFEVSNIRPYPIHAHEHLEGGMDEIPVATEIANGFISKEDKAKLNGVSVNADKTDYNKIIAISIALG